MVFHVVPVLLSFLMSAHFVQLVTRNFFEIIEKTRIFSSFSEVIVIIWLLWHLWPVNSSIPAGDASSVH